MAFNTGGSGGQNPNDPSRPLFGGESPRTSPGPARGPTDPTGSSGGEFNLSDPVGSFIRTVRNVLLRPVDFFRGMARQGDFLNPAIFAVVCGLISSVLGGIVGPVITPLFSDAGGTGEAFVGGVLGFVLAVILSPVYTAVGLLILSGVYHLLDLALVRPSNAGFEVTFRVVCYVSAIQLLTWIPILNIIAGIYGLYVAYCGIREVHATTRQRAAAVVAIPVLVLIVLAILFGAVLAALFSMAQ